MNYRLINQARDGDTAGIPATANFLMNNYAPPAPTAGVPPPMPAGYNIILPVPAKCGDSPCVTDPAGNPIILATVNGVPSNYPDGAQRAAFSAATTNALQAGNTTVNYTASAKLLSMVQITPFGTVTPVMVQTWNITAHGDIATVRNAQAEVSAILETPMTPAFGYAAFATNNGCAALSFNGTSTTDSYDSGALALVGGGGVTTGSFFIFMGKVSTNT